MTISKFSLSIQKRIFDVLGSMILILLIWPLFILVGLSILISSGRPIIFCQKRTGLNKKIFTIYKFRTMVTDAEKRKEKLLGQNEAPGPMFKISHDPRFIGLGRFLSQSGLDEIPQLLNILKGEMSLVGPRPLPVEESSRLPKNWDFRFAVKPGIFSYWTLDDKRHESMKEWRELEAATIKISSLRHEARLIVRVLIHQLANIIRKFLVF
ncbi:MAG: sugar transferase [Patescibacteria group bacterium]